MSERVVLKLGAAVGVNNRDYRIHQVVDLETVLVQDSESGDIKRLKVDELGPVVLQTDIPLPTADVELLEVPEAAWQIARQRLAAIRPVTVQPVKT